MPLADRRKSAENNMKKPLEEHLKETADWLHAESGKHCSCHVAFDSSSAEPFYCVFIGQQSGDARGDLNAAVSKAKAQTPVRRLESEAAKLGFKLVPA